MKTNTYGYIGGGLIFYAGSLGICWFLAKTHTENKLKPQVEDLLARITYLENGVTKTN